MSEARNKERHAGEEDALDSTKDQQEQEHQQRNKEAENKSDGDASEKDETLKISGGWSFVVIAKSDDFNKKLNMIESKC